MKRFLGGILVGLIPWALPLVAQRLASEKVVQPQLLLENQKVKMVRWVLEPGEGTPVHTHQLDHIAVIIRGSTVRDVDSSGEKQVEQKAGDALYVPGTGRTHSFANAGKTAYEAVAIELK